MKIAHNLFLAPGLLWLAASRLLAGEGHPDAIPPLRPPRGEIPPGFWEQHGTSTVLASIAVLTLAGLAAWRLTRPKPPLITPPEIEARRELEKLLDRTEDGPALSKISQVLRRYVAAAFNLRPGELNTAEFCATISASESLDPGLAASLAGFLRKCDEQKFSPAPPAPRLNAARQALALVEEAELRRAALRQPAAGPRTAPAKS